MKFDTHPLKFNLFRHFETFQTPFKFDIKKAETPSTFIDELEKSLKDFTFQKFPILSPKLFSLFPENDTLFKEQKSNNNAKPSILSPNMFSFHEEGIFSLPTLFKVFF